MITLHYVCSDIHGRWDKYERIFKETDLNEEDTLYVLGDVIDRGPDGMKILLDLMKRKSVKFFLGNHEMFLCLLTSRADEEVLELWMRNGGGPTLKAFMALDHGSQEAVVEFIKASYVAIPELKAGEETFYLVHAAPCPKYLKGPVMYRDFKEHDMEELHLMIWSRLDKLRNKRGNLMDSISIPGRRAVVGHTITTCFSPNHVNEKGQPKIYFAPDFVGIDCGCARKGEECCLGVLRLEDRKEYYI